MITIKIKCSCKGFRDMQDVPLNFAEKVIKDFYEQHSDCRKRKKVPDVKIINTDNENNLK
jgi:hypothetical protein